MNQLTRPICCFAALIFATAVLAKQPNIIIVMTDDQGYPELSVNGNPILKTPHLDHLHSESLRLEDYHVSPMCAPTRGQLMTGLDAARNGAINVSSGRGLLRPEVPIIANFFGDVGYETGLFGKWHLGSNYPFRPEDRGFDQTVWFPSSHIGSVPDYWGNDYFDDTYVNNGKWKQYEGYCTDVVVDMTIDWLDNKRDKSKPFFLCSWQKAPHRTWMPAARHFKYLDDVEVPEPSTLFDDYEGRSSALKIQDMTIDKNINIAFDVKVTPPVSTSTTKQIIASAPKK